MLLFLSCKRQPNFVAILKAASKIKDESRKAVAWPILIVIFNKAEGETTKRSVHFEMASQSSASKILGVLKIWRKFANKIFSVCCRISKNSRLLEPLLPRF